jgi:hypothetical protein
MTSTYGWRAVDAVTRRTLGRPDDVGLLNSSPWWEPERHGSELPKDVLRNLEDE